MLKQTTVFVFDFKDLKSAFKTLINKFKQLDLDLNENILLTYNVILCSMYQDKELPAVISMGPDLDS